ncbi:MAG: PQQ-dependent sugar dehydrogenase [Marinobacter sp.]|uniref:PQQ-dependent sugar dehydrogenase n=1 Tax=Marinobacter sp. TaxID=50741 RepID=UPI00299F018C|nr:PQQ-dependent sugar dehydrogenase [Marinobacter sp.]MDX1636060.1 PQQ-dependent sugar dehydrogenase [Marinobacter sp.]
MPTLLTRARRIGSLRLRAQSPHNHNTAMRNALAALLLLAPFMAASADQQEAPERVTSASVGDLDVETLATLEFPWALAVLPGNRMLITEKPGHLRIWEAGELSDPVKGVPDVVYRGAGDQGGLLDVALDPDFDSNQRIYLSYVEAAEQQPSGTHDLNDARFATYVDTSDDIVRGGAVARGRLDGNRLRDVEVIWRQEPKTLGRGHFGHRLTFAPDGKLFITSGDRMRFDPAQNLNTNLGKIVRINTDGSIPEDNPFAGKDDARGDVWSYGHRNILAATMHPALDQLLVFEMGPLGGDEVNLIEKGGNYGWPEVSNGSHYNRATIPPHAGTDQYKQPLRTWTPVISPSGALVYDGTLMPEWQNSVLVGGLSSKAIVRLEMDGERIAVEERIDMGRRIRDLVQAPDDSLYALVDAKEGKLIRLLPVRTDAGRPAVAPE